MKYGAELIKQLESDIYSYEKAIAERNVRIANCETDEDDCFISARCDDRGIAVAKDKIRLIQNGGCMWFTEYATLDGTLVNAHWCNTKYGSSLRAEMPNGDVVWTTAMTQKGLAKKGLKRVRCLRPAWFRFSSNASGMMGVFSGSYVPFPSDVNYSTGEPAKSEPLEIMDCE